MTTYFYDGVDLAAVIVIFGLLLVCIVAIICTYKYSVHKIKMGIKAMEEGYTQTIAPGSDEPIWVRRENDISR